MSRLSSFILFTACLLLTGCLESDTASSVTSDDSPKPSPVAQGEPAEGANDMSEEKEYPPAPEGKVLRHAVFFSFRDTTTEEEVQEVVDAFRALPSKIDAIIDFAWGINNSPESLNDGFTHCFLLTFKDEAGRAEYLPHPEHKNFGKVLSGKNDGTFVIDYWGDEGEPLEKELKHAVFFRFTKEAAKEDIQKVEEAFAALPSKIDAIKRFEWGTNNSPETKDEGFTHCFMVTFDSEEGRAAYLPHPDHEAFVQILKPHLDAPRVLDFWAQK